MFSLLTSQTNVETTKPLEDCRWPVSKKAPTTDLNGQVNLNPWKDSMLEIRGLQMEFWIIKMWSINTVGSIMEVITKWRSASFLKKSWQTVYPHEHNLSMSSEH